MKLTPVAEKLLERKYYLKDKHGDIAENFDQLCSRVAVSAASVEGESSYWAARFFELINNLMFLPAGRILANLGRTNAVFNCYTLPIEDSRDSIYQTLKNSADIFAHGGGIGFDFSSIREYGSPVSNGSRASGPVSFLKLYNTSADIISQASRRGAMLACLRCDHPDILDFIVLKGKERLTHFNLSVGITDVFMEHAEAGEDFYLSSRYDDTIYDGSAVEMLYAMATQAHDTGDPGILFLDRINEDNPTPHLGRIKVTNPCLPGDATFLTRANGETKMLDLKVGDWVWDGVKYVEVIDKWSNGIKDVYKANTVSGSLRATLDHKVVTRDGKRPLWDASNILYMIGQTARCFDILYLELDGEEEVFDFTVDSPEHVAWVDGFIVSNCGEAPLLDGESCCLGSVNLVEMLENTQDGCIFDEEKFVYTVSVGIRFLDNMHDLNKPVFPFLGEAALRTRKVGLGLMGWADALILLGIPYDSEEAREFAQLLGSIMKFTAYETSKVLAEEKGAYPAYDKNKSKNIWYPDIPVTPTRNALFLEFAPTGCYDEETEILTKDGWKKFCDISYSDDFMTYNKESEHWEYQYANEIFEADYNGPMYHLKHRSFDLMVTPEHRMFKKTSCTCPTTEIIKMEDINSFPLAIPQKGTWDGKDPEYFELPRIEKSWVANKNKITKVYDRVRIPIEAWLQFMGYYLSEGCHGSGVSAIFITQIKKESADKMFEDLSALPFVVSRIKTGIRITSRQISEYTKTFGKAKEKFVPQFIKQLSPKLIRIFLDAYILGDGHRKEGRSTEIYTASKIMADDIQELFIKSGSRATVSHRRREYKFDHGATGMTDSYTIREIKRDTSHIRKRNIKVVNYEGKIYCVSVPNSLVLVRRNGFTTICGNSIALLAGVNSGIEPIFALTYTKNVTEGEGVVKYQIKEVNKHLSRYVSEEEIEFVKKHNHFSSAVDQSIVDIFKDAHQIAPMAHLEMQAAWQKNVGGAISKTINLPSTATVEDIKEVMELAWKLRLKGITVFRDGCLDFQVMER